VFNTHALMKSYALIQAEFQLHVTNYLISRQIPVTIIQAAITMQSPRVCTAILRTHNLNSGEMKDILNKKRGKRVILEQMLV